jgi:hypothetical protein
MMLNEARAGRAQSVGEEFGIKDQLSPLSDRQTAGPAV